METLLATIVFVVCMFIILGFCAQIAMLSAAISLGDKSNRAAALNILGEFAKRAPIAFAFVLCLYVGLFSAVIYVMSICWPLM